MRLRRTFILIALLQLVFALTVSATDGDGCTTLLKNRKWTKVNNSIPGNGNLQGAAFLPASLNGIDGKDRVYIFKQVSGGAANSYSYYDVSTGTWTYGQQGQNDFTWAAVTHMGSASFGPSVVSSYTGSDGNTYTCNIPFVYATGHTFLDASGNIVDKNATGASKYITCAAMDLENQRIVKVFAFPDRTDDCIMAYDFAGNRIWVIGYTQGKTGVSPYVIDEYRNVNMTDFLSGNPTKWNYTDITRQTVTKAEGGGTNTPITVPSDGSPYCVSAQIGGPDDDGVQRTLENGTVQDCFYHDNHLYVVTGRGSLYNRTEHVKIHCYYVGEDAHDYDKTIVVPLHQESQGIVYDSTNDNIYMTVTGNPETGLYKYATRAAGDNSYDDLNFQEAQEVSPATNPATYTITNGYELGWFLDQVYAGRTDINAVLANNIDMTGITLPTTYYVYDKTNKFESQYAFRGTFDGANHTISNLTIGSTPYDNDGLFPYIIGATIKNLGVKGTITLTNASHASDDATYNVKNVGFIGTAEGSCTVTGVDVTNFTITGTGVSSSTNINNVIGNDQGDVTMTGVTGVDTDTYVITWLDSDGTTIIKQTQVIKDRVIIAPANPSKDGYIFSAWNPAFTEGTTATANATYTATYVENPYDSNGFKKNSTSTDADYYQPADLVNGWYEIDNAGKMFWFANQVNAGNAAYNAKVTKDIDMDGTNHADFPGIGYYHSSDNTQRKPFSGNFDGGKHRIYNCNITTNNSSYWGSGLIGYATGANKTIKDFTLEGTITAKCGARAGGVLGYIADGYNISGITSSVTINSTTFKTGGVAGFINKGSISKCRFNGTINNSNNWTGGIAAELLDASTMTDCLFDGTINATTSNKDAVGGIVAIAGQTTSSTFTNCLSYGTITTKSNGTNTGKVFAKVGGPITLTNVYYGAQGTSTPTVDYDANGKSITGSVTAITTQTWKEIKIALNNGRTPTVWGINSKEYPVPGEVDAAEYTVTFIANGGSECASVTKAANSVITLPTPTKSGYVFTGWTVAADGTGTKLAGGANYTITDDVTLYAQWAEAYTITFDSKGGSACDAVTKVANSVITLPTSTRTGFVFNNWNTAEDGSGTKYNAGASYTITATATLYAQWTEAYTITFNSNGGSACASVTNVAGTEITLPTSTRDEYLFNNWNTQEDGTGDSYNAGGTYTITANATLYAQWTLDETGDYRNGFHKTHAKTAEDYYQAPTQITAERCTALGIDESYATQGYYEVKNAGNMFWISKYFSTIENNRKFVMTADIDMAGNDDNHKDWAGIATTYSSDGSTHFQGVFDGLGHKFTNYYMKSSSGSYKAMFGVVTKATIKNFSIDGKVDIESDNAQQGVVVGRFNEGPNTIEDIHSSVAITIKDGKKPTSIGGIIGQCSSGGNLTTINRCRYSGTITGNSAYNGLGGILGNTEGKVTLTNCLFDGSISSTSTQAVDVDKKILGIRIGGLVGGQTGQPLTIKNCLAVGTISVSSVAVGDNGRSGIVFGCNSTTQNLTISDTYYSTTGCTSGLKAVGLNNCTNKSLVVTATVTDAQIANGEAWELLVVNNGQWTQDFCVESSTPVPSKEANVGKLTLNAACNDSGEEGVEATDVKVYGTYSSSKAFKVPYALTVAAVGYNNEGLVVDAYETGATVPANTGVMVSAAKWESGTKAFYFNTSTEEGDAKTSVNLLRASGDAGITAADMASNDANCTYYRLTMHNGEKIGYWWGAENGAAFALAANKAYLAVPNGTQVKAGFWFGDSDANGIDEVTAEMTSGKAYNLAGQRVAPTAKGIVIINGKKYINK